MSKISKSALSVALVCITSLWVFSTRADMDLIPMSGHQLHVLSDHSITADSNSITVESEFHISGQNESLTLLLFNSDPDHPILSVELIEAEGAPFLTKGQGISSYHKSVGVGRKVVFAPQALSGNSNDQPMEVFFNNEPHFHIALSNPNEQLQPKIPVKLEVHWQSDQLIASFTIGGSQVKHLDIQQILADRNIHLKHATTLTRVVVQGRVFNQKVVVTDFLDITQMLFDQAHRLANAASFVLSSALSIINFREQPDLHSYSTISMGLHPTLALYQPPTEREIMEVLMRKLRLVIDEGMTPVFIVTPYFDIENYPDLRQVMSKASIIKWHRTAYWVDQLYDDNHAVSNQIALTGNNQLMIDGYDGNIKPIVKPATRTITRTITFGLKGDEYQHTITGFPASSHSESFQLCTHHVPTQRRMLCKIYSSQLTTLDSRINIVAMDASGKMKAFISESPSVSIDIDAHYQELNREYAYKFRSPVNEDQPETKMQYDFKVKVR